jgi:hypothetical protein
VKYQDENVDSPKCYPECTPDEDLDPLALLQREILQRLKEEKFYDTRNRKWEKSEYQMRKDHLFRRMQIEKNEKAYQDCLCKVRIS